MCKVTICLVQVGMFGNLTDVREMSGHCPKFREVLGENILLRKTVYW